MLERVRELVHRRLERERAGRLAGRAHERRRRDVEPDAAGATCGRSGTRRACGSGSADGSTNSSKREVVDVDVVAHRGELARGVGAEHDVLARVGAVPDQREHLLSRQHELDGAADHLRRHRRERDVRPRRPFAAEAAADVVRDDADVLLLEIEQRGQPLADAEDALRRVVDRHAIVALPDSHRSRASPSGCGSRSASRRSRRSSRPRAPSPRRSRRGPCRSARGPSFRASRARWVPGPGPRCGGAVRNAGAPAPARAARAPACRRRPPRSAGRRRRSCRSAGPAGCGRPWLCSSAPDSFGAFLCVSTASTPGARSASAVSMSASRPVVMALETITASATFATAVSAAYGARPVTFSGPSTRSTRAPDLRRSVAHTSPSRARGRARSSAGPGRP